MTTLGTMNQRSPPDTKGQPQNPPPQTVEGTLQHEGMQMTLSTPLSGGFLDIQQIASLWRLTAVKTLSVNDNVGEHIFTWKTAFESGESTWMNFMSHWRSLAHLCFDFTSYNIEWRLWCVKPQRAVGKYYIRWAPFAFVGNTTTGTGVFGSGLASGRSPLVEWDLARTDYIDFVTPKLKRYARTATRVTAMGGGDYALHDELENRGYCTLQCANPIKVGSIFPDTYDVFIFSRLVNYELSGPSDFRIQSLSEGLPRWYHGLRDPIGYYDA